MIYRLSLSQRLTLVFILHYADLCGYRQCCPDPQQ